MKKETDPSRSSSAAVAREGGSEREERALRPQPLVVVVWPREGFAKNYFVNIALSALYYNVYP